MNVLFWIALILVVVWLLGLLLQIGGVLIYWALVIAGVLFVIGLFTGRRRV